MLDINFFTRQFLFFILGLRNEHVKGKTITLKVKYKDFVQITRSVTLPETIDDGGVIYQSCCDLLDKTEAGKKPIRLLGVTVSLPKSHQDQKQLSLFNEEPVSLKKKSLNTAIDRIYEKFGEDKIIPGTLLKK